MGNIPIKKTGLESVGTAYKSLTANLSQLDLLLVLIVSERAGQIPGLFTVPPPQSFQSQPIPQNVSVPVQNAATRKQMLGAYGAHNFYVGRKSQAIAQLIIGLLGAVFTAGIVTLGVWGWAIIEAITVKEDGEGRPMV